MSKTLYLARHGQTEWNVLGKKQGQLDSPLTAGGIEHARQQGLALRGRGVEQIYSSPLGRALRTAQIMSEVLDVRVVIIDALAEVHHGEFAGLTEDQLALDAHWAMRREQLYEWTFPGGESYRAADLRAAEAVSRILGASAMTAVIVAHEMIGRMLVRNLCDLSTTDALLRKHPHGTIFEWCESTREISTVLS